MSHPSTTSQKPKPPLAAPSNLSMCRYLPRSTPSMSLTATFNLVAPLLRSRSSTGWLDGDKVRFSRQAAPALRKILARLAVQRGRLRHDGACMILTWPIALAVLLAALLHASWNALVKSGADKAMDTSVMNLIGGV